jgi:DnaJ-domain-containing protein 1
MKETNEQLTLWERLKLAEQFKKEALDKILNCQEGYIDGYNSAEKKNKSKLKDLLNKYKSQLKDLQSAKLSKRIDEEKIKELEIRIDTLNRLL